MKKDLTPTSVIEEIQNLRLSDFHYELPDKQIAKYPTSPRDQSRLLSYKQGRIQDHHFFQLPNILPANSLLVFNQTKVLPARVQLRRSTGAKIEVLLLTPLIPHSHELALQSQQTCVWEAMIGNKKRWKEEETLEWEGLLGTEGLSVKFSWENRDENQVRISWEAEQVTFAELIQSIGAPPLPPYLNRGFEASDWENYQTVYARDSGAVAAPTAGLHFTENVLRNLRQKGMAQAFVTLHVGAGTFAPVKTEMVSQHSMHKELFGLSTATIQQLATHKGPIIPVGTTSLRVLETLYWIGIYLLQKGKIPAFLPQEYPYQVYQTAFPPFQEAFSCLYEHQLRGNLAQFESISQLFIMPGYTFQVASGLITNFHQPHSSLILLVAALLGSDWKKVYEHALKEEYRFLSYGDSSLLLP